MDGKAFAANQTTKTSKAWISDGNPHVSLVKVRHDSIEAYLDDTLISSLKTDYRGIKLFEQFKMRHPYTLGISMGQAITIRSIDIIEISGPGKVTR